MPSTAKLPSAFDLYKAVGENQSDLLPIASRETILVKHPDSSGSNSTTVRTRNDLLAFMDGDSGRAYTFRGFQPAKQIPFRVKLDVPVVGCWIQVITKVHLFRVAIDFSIERTFDIAI